MKSAAHFEARGTAGAERSQVELAVRIMLSEEEFMEEAVSFLRRRLCAAAWAKGAGAPTPPILPDVENICR